MTEQYLRELRHRGAVREIAKLKFPFPSEDFPDLETVLNDPERAISVGENGGQGLFPDIVVVRQPGQWLKMMAEIETPETVTDEQAIQSWKRLAEVGELYLYVPMGLVQEAKRLCKKHGVTVAGIRTWRFRPVWGLEVNEAE